MPALRKILEWLAGEKSLTLATWGLVVATLFLYLDGRAKSKEQKERWEREDRSKADEAKPRAVIELGRRPKSLHPVALCYNLGEHPFVIDKLIITVQDVSKVISDLVGPHVVLPGTYVPVPIDCSELPTREKKKLYYATITLELKGAAGIVSTEPVWFRFYPNLTESGYGWNVGGPETALPGVISQQPRVLLDEIEGG